MIFKLNYFYKLSLWVSSLGLLVLIVDFGFSQSELFQQILDGFYFFVIALGLVSTFFRYVESPQLFKRKVFIFDLVSVLYTLYILYVYIFVGEAFKTDLILENPLWVILAVVLTFFREFFELKLDLRRTYLNPAQIFILSFLAIILVGALLLMLPNASHEKLSFLDAFFTSTSAVCVTGLIVVDTGTFFTPFGQSVVLFLIQIGGLGILTFASYFSYFFKGGSSYENQLTLSEMTNAAKIGEVFSTLKNIILITASVEAIAAFLIFSVIGQSNFETIFDRFFFSMFHAVSAFCNAGFSTLSNSIFEVGYRENYFFQLVIVGTFILGGLGFPIVVNILEYLKHFFQRLILKSRYEKRYQPWVLKINSRITLATTVLLTVAGFFLVLILEFNRTLSGHSAAGKVVLALFTAATPRTAGFNVVDMGELAFPTIMITLLLMWIGASPASTGGGIKTSTFAIATLNILSLARGKSKLEIFKREIADISVKRAFATISLSLVIIGIGITSLSIFDPQLGLLNIGFECFSAYSTVGLSLGITDKLSDAGKAVIIILMFVGRVSMLSLVIAVFKKVKHKNYRYPSEEITIN